MLSRRLPHVWLPRQALRLGQAQGISEAAKFGDSQVALFSLLTVPLDSPRRIFFEADLIPTSRPIPDRRAQGNGAIRRSWCRLRNGGVKPRDMNSVYIADAHAADCRQNVEAQEDFISLACSRLALRPNMRLEERGCDLAEGRNRTLKALGRDWIKALFNGTEESFRRRTRFVGS